MALVAMAVLSLTWHWRSGQHITFGSSLGARGPCAPTDLLTVSTATLLDLHGEGLTSDEKRELVRAHQQMYCRCGRPPRPARRAAGSAYSGIRGKPSGCMHKAAVARARRSQRPAKRRARRPAAACLASADPRPRRRCPRAPAPRSARRPDPPGTTRTLFSNVSMVVYSDNDIVSGFLKGESHSWETSVSGARGRLGGRSGSGGGLMGASLGSQPQQLRRGVVV